MLRGLIRCARGCLLVSQGTNAPAAVGGAATAAAGSAAGAAGAAAATARGASGWKFSKEPQRQEVAGAAGAAFATARGPCVPNSCLGAQPSHLQVDWGAGCSWKDEFCTANHVMIQTRLGDTEHPRLGGWAAAAIVGWAKPLGWAWRVQGWFPSLNFRCPAFHDPYPGGGEGGSRWAGPAGPDRDRWDPGPGVSDALQHAHARVNTATALGVRGSDDPPPRAPCLHAQARAPAASSMA